MNEEALREKLAELEHDRWSGWEKYRATAAGENHVSGEANLERWARQRTTPYAELSEAEKDSDRAEADKTLAVVMADFGRPLYVVFDGPPAPESGRFVEVEDADGNSVGGIGWTASSDGLWRLGPLYKRG